MKKEAASGLKTLDEATAKLRRDHQWQGGHRPHRVRPVPLPPICRNVLDRKSEERQRWSNGARV
jgi:hypothetical protein